MERNRWNTKVGIGRETPCEVTWEEAETAVENESIMVLVADGREWGRKEREGKEGDAKSVLGGIAILNQKLLGATVGVGFTKTLFILVATFWLDRVGRTPLLLSSVGGMIASLMVLGTGLTVVDRSAEGTVMWAVACFFSIGLGPITWVYGSEISPLRLRAQGASMGVRSRGEPGDEWGYFYDFYFVV
ncbi:Polyol transporter 5 [Acorus calamus]|uniref:Polyol transporter 5 n=1 Tax=Acorus calamus TaxID=4465 RepID=A0AAV9FGN6_ACOCL|nr:Polyol transporter 5 [Acorus calamus]